MGDYVDMNFKVGFEFRQAFKVAAANLGISEKQLLLNLSAMGARAELIVGEVEEAEATRLLGRMVRKPTQPRRAATDGQGGPEEPKFDVRCLFSAPKGRRIAIFIDADQVRPETVEILIEAISPFAQIVEVRVYRIFSSERHKGWNNLGARIGAISIHTPEVASGKNAADIQLTIDAVTTLHRGTADIFVIVSNDGDFAPLARELVAAGKQVLGVGSHQASQAFRAACSEFRFFDI